MLKRALCISMLIVAALSLPLAGMAQRSTAVDERSPNLTLPLTPQQFFDGWIMLFDGSSTYGWLSTGDAKWGVDGSTLQVAEGGPGTLVTTSEFGDFKLHVECRLDKAAKASLLLRGPVLQGSDKPVTGSIEWPIKTGKTAAGWSTIEVTAAGDHITVLVNGKRAASKRAGQLLRGTIGIGYKSGKAEFRQIWPQPLNLQSIFDGKTLNGWAPAPDHHTQVSVSDGCLKIEKGDGDEQTTGKWGDFVFQSDVFCQSDYCNSGIFFRANAGKFWSGYECQIRNQWFGTNRAKALDCGTGGIYNRQDARWVVPNDREWYEVTIVANGFHIATWVNGYQVTDVVDKRPIDQTNARHGARYAAGVMSLQGHNSDGDVRYRKLRVVEMPKARYNETQDTPAPK